MGKYDFLKVAPLPAYPPRKWMKIRPISDNLYEVYDWRNMQLGREFSSTKMTKVDVQALFDSGVDVSEAVPGDIVCKIWKRES
jgi:hypothetical protein